MPQDDSSLILDLANDYLQRCQSGECPELSEYIQSHPNLESEIRRVFPMMLLMEQDAGNLEPQEPVFPNPKRLGDYRLQREIGRGGMGIVYEAIQQSLDRRVALKVCTGASMLTERGRLRFAREARSAAMLHHTNIVPVFGVGEDQGLIYFAMQYIEGADLTEVIPEVARLMGDPGEERLTEELYSDTSNASKIASQFVGADSSTTRDNKGNQPRSSEALSDSNTSKDHSNRTSYWLRIAHLMLQASDALGFAHQLGVLHRDIKPGNLMLDSSGTLWVMDFGLSKMIHEGDLTVDGELIGTLRYMSPEQCEGLADPRSDLYSLGLTLYELTTFRQAFMQPDRPALLKAIANETPPSPKSLNNRIPKDLETITLKLIEKNPARRYQTATELSDDLQRFVEGEPILARRTSFVERGIKWCQRRPAVASLLFALVATFCISFSLVTWKWLDAEEAKKLAQQRQSELTRANAAEKEARQLANKRFADAQNAVDDFLVAVANNKGILSKTPGTQALRTELLSKAQNYYQAFLSEAESDEDLLYQAINANEQLAKIMNQLTASSDESVAQYEKLIAMLDQVVHRDPDWNDPKPVRLLAKNTGELAVAHFDRQEYKQSIDHLLAAKVIHEKLVAKFNEPDDKLTYAVTLHNLGHAYAKYKGKPFGGVISNISEAEKYYRSAVDLARASVDLERGKPKRAKQFGNMLSNLATLLNGRGNPEEALAFAEESIKVATRATELAPDDADIRFRLASVHNRYALVLHRNGRRDESATAFEKAIDINAQLVRENPDIPEYRQNYTACLNNIGAFYGNQKESERALHYFKIRLEQCVALKSQRPEAIRFAIREAAALESVLHEQSLLDQQTAVAESLKRQIRLYRDLHERDPDNSATRISLAEYLCIDESADLDELLRLTDAVSKQKSPGAFHLAIRIWCLHRAGLTKQARVELERMPKTRKNQTPSAKTLQEVLTWLLSQGSKRENAEITRIGKSARGNNRLSYFVRRLVEIVGDSELLASYVPEARSNDDG